MGPGSLDTDASITEWMRASGATANHPCGTCAIGTVVGAELRVLGIERLRVANASAIPSIVSDNGNACVSMMAEKAADMIRGKPMPP